MDTQLSEIRLTKEQAEEQLEIFRRIYSKVRLLSAEELKEENTTQAGKGENYWKESCLGAGKYCDDCVSVVALKEKARKTKLKYIGTELYEVTAQYVEVDGQSCVLEMIQNLGNGADIAQSDEIKDTKAFYEALYTDALTGAYNRRYYEDQIKKKSMHAGVAMFDLDDFKLANDTYGHDIGDAFLKTEVAVIQKMIRKTDALIRYGGDEFLLIMPGISEDSFEQKLRDIRRQICLVEMPESIGSRISASVGAVMAQGEQIWDAIARADRYMYQAKSHKNAIVTEWGTIAMDDSLPQVNAKKKKRQRILIVDDSEMNREILYEMLKDEFDILEAENGKEALEVLERYGCEISLVLLDIVMPIMDGFEVLEHMNEKDMIEEIPVVMISSEDSTSFIRRAYEMGVSDYISRPYDAQIVYKRVYNTIKLYAKQRRLTVILTEQIRAKEESRKIMIGILSHIIEFRNGESGPHVQHINVLTQLLLGRLVQISDQYHLSWMDRDLIVMASSLHDIGKIGIDDKILNKKGRLTDEEFEIMKQHTVIGVEILEELQYYQDEPLVKTAREICRWHHERYDGRGYPDGLKGEDIPISAQVVSLADVYDALVSKRVYKASYSHEKAMQMILNGECGAFNPLLLTCLKDIEDEIQEMVYDTDVVMFDSAQKEHEKKKIGKIIEMSEKSGGGSTKS